MKFASLGSGSEGNALLISAAAGSHRPNAGTTVMLDCGFALRETERRMLRIGIDPSDVAAIVVTHEHSDHVSGVFKFARRYRIPVWLSYGTYQAIADHAADVDIQLCADGQKVAIGDLELTPYTVPHDAREPIQYIASDGDRRLGVLTDAGQSTSHMIQALGACDSLLLECNHDRAMLENSPYPAFLKRRIGGAYGHLANETSAEILQLLDKSRLKQVVGAHLSRQNNTPALARAALESVLGGSFGGIDIACQDEGFGWRDV
ncbi:MULTISPECIES: MBL fold metallo-hydrolase [unclassified Herbaspirillum]|uniref:MBL fold metallo-hydrolase n=1 Tax=unclassified Herbaspirillum TaxID=2624150 RepID=UPI0011545B1C|nr:MULTISPECIES: MBL fold metallo-hydrolase [unclassified Herbaspirillum]MBB5391941.1 phosphoribosyl 1,2-cyclic phosphodiesterase [Herbaspirillum sp. SJZ102]TQK13401.1 phosphoribosyl 1,2-cyclic phosphodiesterase [Herbaspirillum sp. SJZ130]TQK15405.1 phosphoribosyl 1,2-cyclic phosphodiesterase [Herbaspirillum sp. SJZ106]TWC71300.1 phosphoribosyl 1,2-cyclic phosphodiesterase [Herbaspirillum sp. SJZ099]